MKHLITFLIHTLVVEIACIILFSINGSSDATLGMALGMGLGVSCLTYIIMFVFGGFNYPMTVSQCPKCKKLFSMKRAKDKECRYSEEDVKIQEAHYYSVKNGTKTYYTEEDAVQMTSVYTVRCKYCGHEEVACTSVTLKK